MSEISKLYENTGIKLKYSGWLDMGDLDTQMEYVQCNTKEEWDECCNMSRSDFSSDNKEWCEPKMEYPPFTAEKQLELFKLIIVERFLVAVYGGIPNLFSITALNVSAKASCFEECLAGYFNDLFEEHDAKDLKEKVKRILEK